MMAGQIKRIVLARHIAGAPTPHDFRLETLPIPARGRIVSGQVADHNFSPAQAPGIHNGRAFIGQRLRMAGMVVFDDRPQFSAAQAAHAGPIRADRIRYREEIFAGIENLAKAFCRLFTGKSFGRRLLRV